jgi:hypothetical protein
MGKDGRSQRKSWFYEYYKIKRGLANKMINKNTRQKNKSMF